MCRNTSRSLGSALSIHEMSDSISETDYSVFLLKIRNIGKERITLDRIAPLVPSGIEIKHDLDEGVIKLNPNENIVISFKCKLTENFDIPPLSFNTIVISIHVYVKEFLKYPILASAGFENRT